METKLRDCAVCGRPIYAKKYQDKKVRTCQPSCARALADREHPDLQASPETRLDRKTRLLGAN